MTADPMKAARAALYVARKTFADGGTPNDDAFTAYHGTPHEFEPEPDAPYGRFRDTAIGSGEGAQAYGYGHYLAGNEGIAKHYQNALTSSAHNWKVDNKSLSDLFTSTHPDDRLKYEIGLEVKRGKAWQDAVDFVKSQYEGKLSSKRTQLYEPENIPYFQKALERLDFFSKNPLNVAKNKGHLLETRVRAKPEHFLDWDKPLSEQHPAIQEIARTANLDKAKGKTKGVLKAWREGRDVGAEATGKDLHHALSDYGENSPAAAAVLHAAGIPGIRYLDAGSRGPTGAPIHNYVVFDPKNIDIVRRYAQGGEVYSNHAPRHTMQTPAVAELKRLLTAHRQELQGMKGHAQYAAIDGVMKRISHEHGVSPSKLHDDWVSIYHQTPDAWVMGDHGNVVDRALKMTRRGKFAGGGAPASAGPINFAPAAGAFTGLPSPELLNLTPSEATRAAMFAPRRTYTGSGKPVEMSKYIPPAIPALTYGASTGKPSEDEVLDGGSSGGGGGSQGQGSNASEIGQTAEIGGWSKGGNVRSDSEFGEREARGGRIHRADGGDVDNQLPEPAAASMPSKRQSPFGVTPPQGAVPTPMSQATRNLTEPGQVSIKSMSDAFDRAISNHQSLSPGEKITNARQAAQNISEFLGTSKTGKMNALLTANGKLMKAAKSQSGKEPVTISDGRGVETLGLSLFPDFKEGQFRVCGNSDSCRDSCIGKKSNAYGMDPTQASDPIPLTRQEREGMGGRPRMAALARTHALMRDPESFAVYLHDLIDHEKIAAARRGNLLGVRLNTLSDVPPSVFAPIIKAHPDVAFYDYTKMNYDPIAPNHHYTYSSTGLSQPELGVENPFQNWHKSRNRLDQGENVAMAFSHKSGEAFPRMVHDEETGKHYKVVSGDEHDFRPLDIQDEGKAGVIVALKNIAKDLGHESASQKSSGFFVHHDPGFAKDKKGNFVRNESGERVPQNMIYTIPTQQKKRAPLTVIKRSGQNV